VVIAAKTWIAGTAGRPADRHAGAASIVAAAS
jgi:hypothetical protein